MYLSVGSSSSEKSLFLPNFCNNAILHAQHQVSIARLKADYKWYDERMYEWMKE